MDRKCGVYKLEDLQELSGRTVYSGVDYRYDDGELKIEPIARFSYDGHGNRLSETRAGATTSYTYDAGNRVRTSSAGES